uniref:Uncharacterized protein n=1 Tax=Oryza glumipatula TaxID=40148 RepID=A0A0E0AQJ4_9ORYZ
MATDARVGRLPSSSGKEHPPVPWMAAQSLSEQANSRLELKASSLAAGFATHHVLDDCSDGCLPAADGSGGGAGMILLAFPVDWLRSSITKEIIRMPSSMVALYWIGTSMRAASANADSFCCCVELLDMIDSIPSIRFDDSSP